MRLRKIALLTYKNIDPFIDDHLLVDALNKTGRYDVQVIPWDEDANWESFDKVLIRTTWDYTKRISEFLEKMKLINLKTKLYNSLATVEWNYHKKYLKDLESQGVLIVPTKLFHSSEKVFLPSEWKESRFIIKPCISASSFNTKIYTRDEIAKEKYQELLFEADWMIQPFLEEIHNGELSLHFFNRAYSHAIIKVPAKGDFRVQEDYGGNVLSYTPTAELIQISLNTISKIKEPLLFARVDVVLKDGKYFLMELELIEPSLYFRKDPESPERFIKALDEVFEN